MEELMMLNARRILEAELCDRAEAKLGEPSHDLAVRVDDPCEHLSDPHEPPSHGELPMPGSHSSAFRILLCISNELSMVLTSAAGFAMSAIGDHRKRDGASAVSGRTAYACR